MFLHQKGKDQQASRINPNRTLGLDNPNIGIYVPTLGSSCHKKFFMKPVCECAYDPRLYCLSRKTARLVCVPGSWSMTAPMPPCLCTKKIEPEIVESAMNTCYIPQVCFCAQIKRELRPKKDGVLLYQNSTEYKKLWKKMRNLSNITLSPNTGTAIAAVQKQARDAFVCLIFQAHVLEGQEQLLQRKHMCFYFCALRYVRRESKVRNHQRFFCSPTATLLLWRKWEEVQKERERESDWRKKFSFWGKKREPSTKVVAHGGWGE